MAQGSPSGASLKTTLRKQIDGECGCEALIASAEVTPYYSYKLISTTNLSLPKEQWNDEFTATTATDTNMSWGIPLATSGSKFFQVVELGQVTHVIATVNAASPLQRTVEISSASVTPNVMLGLYDFRSLGGSSTLKSILITLQGAHVPGTNIEDTHSAFNSVKVICGGVTYSNPTTEWSASKDAGGIVTWGLRFTNMTSALPADATVQLSVAVDVNQDLGHSLVGLQVTAELSSQTILDGEAANVIATDSGNNAVLVQPTIIQGNTVTFTDDSPLDGLLLTALRQTPADGTEVFKGQSYDIASYKIMATNTDVALQSISLDFDTRLWLYADTITVRDDSGITVAQATNLSAQVFTELVVGTDYRIVIPTAPQYVMYNNATNGLTVNVHFRTTSDRQSGTINLIREENHSVDIYGVTDSEVVPLSRSFHYNN